MKVISWTAYNPVQAMFVTAILYGYTVVEEFRKGNQDLYDSGNPDVVAWPCGSYVTMLSKAKQQAQHRELNGYTMLTEAVREYEYPAVYHPGEDNGLFRDAVREKIADDRYNHLKKRIGIPNPGVVWK